MDTNIKQKSVFKFAIYTLICVCLLGVYPYIFNRFLPLPGITIIYLITIVTLLLIIVFCRGKLILLPYPVNIIFLIQLLAWIAYILIHSDILYAQRILTIVLTYLQLLCLSNCQGKVNRFFLQYDKFIVIMAVGGTVCFFLVLFLNFPVLYSYSNPDGRDAFFLGLTSTNSIHGNIIRYAGFFDEPGAMAYWGIWALIFNKLFFYNKNIEKILIVCLSFTFSLAYFIQLFIYVILFKLQKLSHFIIMLILLTILGIGIYNIATQNPDLYTLTFYRLEVSDDGNLNGDNRSELAEAAQRLFYKSPIIGNGLSNTEQIENIYDNPYETLAIDGIIGTIIVYLPLLFLWFIGNKKIKFALIIIFVGYLQRPFHHNIIFYFLAYSFVLLAIYNKMTKIHK